MLQENRKEILTVEMVEKDIKRELKNEIIWYAFAFIACVIYLDISLGFIEFKIKWNYIVCNIIALIVFIAVIWFLFRLLKSVNAYRKMKYYFVEDRYEGLSKKFLIYKPYECLKFNKYGDFIINYMAEYYPLSKYYNMNMQKLKETSSVGDSFYLVLINKKIIYVYNMKFFELNEEI